jgi:integrase/recombinase XerD
MAYMYKKRGNWRTTVYSNGIKKDIGLGPDLNKAKIIKASIEQVSRNDKFKKNLVETLMELGFLDKNLAISTDDSCVTWEFAKQKLFDYLKNIGRAEGTLYSYNYMFTSLDKILKPSKPSDITPEKADHWIEVLTTTKNPKDSSGKAFLKPTAISVLLRTAKAAFQRFVRWQYLEKNPFKYCEKPKTELSLPRPLSPEELVRLLNASNAPLKRCIKILVYSGMRPDELYNLPWRRVVIEKKPYIHIAVDGDWKPKAHTQRMIPITDELKAALGKPGNPDDLVAGRNETGNIINHDWLGRSFARAVKRAGLSGKKISPYCCRDTYATDLALQGHEAHVIAARLGHRDVSTSMHYVSLARLNTADTRVKNKVV